MAPERTMRSCVLAAEADLAGFRAAARVLLRDGIEPWEVGWSVRDASVAPLAFGDADTALGQASADPDAQADRDPDAGPDAAVRRVPADFVALCRDVILHRDPQRFARLYRLLWRLGHEPSLRHDPLDAEMVLARRMAQAVRRDIHKMRAFVRFRPVDEPGHDTPLHVAWFEPQHHIVETNAPFFERRFAGMRWAILTPERSVRWDGRALQFGPGGVRADAPAADAGEALWLTYYRSIFNPARLKLRAMENEMPRRYWRNLPEAVLIAPLAAEAHARRAAMIEAPATVPRRRIVPLAPAPRSTAADAAQPVDARGAAWAAERDRASHCRECPIGEHATQTVWGEGPIGARVMLVGEQPGDREDLEGRPFVGPAGQLLARAIQRLGWERRALYLTNAVKHFKYEPRGRRRMHKTAAQLEADACAHWLEREVALVAPTVIVALGATAARQLLGHAVPVQKARGQWFTRADGRRVLVTLHPSALLRGDPTALGPSFDAWVDDLSRAGSVPARDLDSDPAADTPP